jgi:predicted O-methyltransferase YrrM
MSLGPIDRLRHRWRQWKNYRRHARVEAIEFCSGLGDSAWLLYGLTRSLKPEVCVEIGSARGKSACYVGLALRENGRGRLYAIDPHAPTDWNDSESVDTFNVIRQNLERVDVREHVEIVRKTSEEAVRDWKVPIDLLFIDGDHSYDGVRRDWELFSPFLSEFGVAAFHDTTWAVGQEGWVDDGRLGVHRLLDELRQEGYPLITINRDYGVTLVQGTRAGVPLMR